MPGGPRWVKNSPDALEMGCLYYPQKQASVSSAADCHVIACYSGAKLTDKHLASKIHCVDSEIVKWLEWRERRKREMNLFIHSERTNFFSPSTSLKPE